MRRRPTPNLTRKRRAPHPGYEWEDGEDFDGRPIAFKLFHHREKSPRYREQRMLRFLKTPAGQAWQRRRMERAKELLATIDELIAAMPDMMSSEPMIVMSDKNESILRGEFLRGAEIAPAATHEERGPFGALFHAQEFLNKILGGKENIPTL